MSKVEVRQVLPAEFPRAIALLACLNADTPRDVVEQRLMTILESHPHYSLYGAFVDGQMQGLSGAWIATKVWCGKYLEIDNFVVAPEARSLGIGTAIMQHLEAHARDNGCEIVALDTYTANKAGHRLYHRLGYVIEGFHFLKWIK